MGASASTPPAETQLQRRHHLAHRNAANAATKDMTADVLLKIVCKIEHSKNKNQPVIGCEYSRIEVDDRHLTIKHAASEHRELLDQFLAACNGKPPWSTKVCFRTVR